MRVPIDFFDSNVLIAATVESHKHHDRCRSRLVKLARSGACCSAHTLAEAYNNLTTRRAVGYGLDPIETARMLEEIRSRFTLVTLTPREMSRALEATAILQLRGAIVYDALIAACARKVAARSIYTLKVGHFVQVAPDLADRIMEP